MSGSDIVVSAVAVTDTPQTYLWKPSPADIASTVSTLAAASVKGEGKNATMVWNVAKLEIRRAGKAPQSDRPELRKRPDEAAWPPKPLSFYARSEPPLYACPSDGLRLGDASGT